MPKDGKKSLYGFADDVKALRARLGIGQTAMAQRLGMKQALYAKWETGTRAITVAGLLKLAEEAPADERRKWLDLAGEQANTKVLRTDVGARSVTHIRIPILSVSAAAGSGWINDAEYEEDEITMPRSVLKARGRIVALAVSGKSMEPTLADGILIIVDAGRHKPTENVGGIVVAWHPDEGVVVKRLVKVEGEMRLASDNVGYLPIPLTSEWTISGAVRWWLQSGDAK